MSGPAVSSCRLVLCPRVKKCRILTSQLSGRRRISVESLTRGYRVFIDRCINGWTDCLKLNWWVDTLAKTGRIFFSDSMRALRPYSNEAQVPRLSEALFKAELLELNMRHLLAKRRTELGHPPF